MAEQSENRQQQGGALGDGARALLIGAAAFIVIFGLKYAQPVVIPILMAGFLAIISYSITGLLRKFCRFPHWLAVVTTVACDFVVLYAVASLIQFLAMDMKATLQGNSPCASTSCTTTPWPGSVPWGWRKAHVPLLLPRRICSM